MAALIWALLGGLFVGTVGTLIGAGGGFLIVPALLVIFPDLPPAEVTAISMLCIAANATSGSIAYLARKTVHIPSALLFSLAALPGAWLGAEITHVLDRGHFDLFFAAVLALVGLFLLTKKKAKQEPKEAHEIHPSVRAYVLGFVISFFVGILASILGIGGGIIHVPLLAYALAYPVHIATGTSHFILATTALVATADHFYRGDINTARHFIWALAGGVVVGAQLGAYLSKKVEGRVILRLLGLAMIMVSLRIFYTHVL